jgi:hypothetical protein
MGYLTENKLNSVLDIPVTLPVTELRMGDWLVIATIKLVTPMKLRFHYLNINLVAATVDIEDISSLNRIWGNLDLCYVALRRDYASGNPGESGALDTLRVASLGVTTRTADAIEFTTPGTYSWIVANNMQPSDEATIPPTTSIDFRLSVAGQARIYLSTD